MCNCADEIDVELGKKNTRLAVAIVFGRNPGSSLIVATERIENRRDGKKAVVVFPTFCPFCGEKIAA